MLALEEVIYSTIIVPLIAFLPAFMAYGIACFRGDLLYHWDSAKREVIIQNLEFVLGTQLSSKVRIRVARDYFRVLSCEGIDIVRLRLNGKANAFVEIRGLENLKEALAKGRGAILCGAHFGALVSFTCSFLGARGFPITLMRRNGGIVRNAWLTHLNIASRLADHYLKGIVQPKLGSAVQVAKILQQNEVIAIIIDTLPIVRSHPSQAVLVDFLNGKAYLFPGVTTIAKFTGAPILMNFARRSPDWRHQVIEISPPIMMDGDTRTIFARCVTAVDAAIRRDPSHWRPWGRADLKDTFVNSFYTQ